MNDTSSQDRVRTMVFSKISEVIDIIEEVVEESQERDIAITNLLEGRGFTDIAILRHGKKDKLAQLGEDLNGGEEDGD